MKPITKEIQQLQESGCVSYNRLPLETKIKLLLALIGCIEETDYFHDQIFSQKTEKIHDLNKERTDLLLNQKKEEAEIINLESKIKTYEKNHKENQILPTTMSR